ncbi:MAG: hypothetical protein A3D24_04080 [Candidatus Blackburnbacteria bacterium RIFCSPHIGHO2_02_FULL_39_13]|uniref:Glycosyl transferase family 1 domain-containing protein n=1 Tax=Candidatus Blackburnbacteria bacterium RIFCSPLOWO2_01_FULL_40_20 TaxID=1797519 RepID=A0A1G1VAL9_9BACT|nr:MAG: hypothetical protein A2694_02655 [Candidatus Blackburnbacteria bacterium RIFCSPHIGHO2_01_FULL_40_17]OGY08409.1 MAG: hypothetical protein A3D24_04080 [Candidatus Blackburnbacteria bacterium RIFCSPHIGHO2_02_FULL_39_13]OGY12495.1 MAG: hypothetical protein A3A77_00780 [Candidatus Blackburnbacteria bacterium RIFCSPLOWO2_01_FULL_40_20]
MRVALVHDYISEFGGAERVLLALSEIWPDAPIYTAFYKNGRTLEMLKGKDVRPSWVQNIPGFSTKLHSPLRILAPLIWGSFDFRDYDVVISSASWYVTKGFGQRGHTSPKATLGTTGKPVEFCYCHTPPRYLYGYHTSVTPNWLTKIYSSVVNPFMRKYDFESAQKVDYFIANSEEVKNRIKRFYNRDAKVIYPPVEVSRVSQAPRVSREYYLTVARVVGGKGLELAVETANKYGFPLKVVGGPSGFSKLLESLKQKAGKNVEFLGFVDDDRLEDLYFGAKAFLALSRDEDFGITPVEAMLAGTPVVAFNGGGYKETVIEGKTGIFFDDYTTEGLYNAIQKLGKTKIKPQDCKKQGEKFSRERFKREIKEYVESVHSQRSQGSSQKH